MPNVLTHIARAQGSIPILPNFQLPDPPPVALYPPPPFAWDCKPPIPRGPGALATFSWGGGVFLTEEVALLWSQRRWAHGIVFPTLHVNGDPVLCLQ